MLNIFERKLPEDLKEKIAYGFSGHKLAMSGYDLELKHLSYVAENENVFVGALIVELFWGAMHVKYLYVPENSRGLGVGTQIMNYMLEDAKKRNCPFVYIETMCPQARGFYEKLGFKVDFSRSGFEHGTTLHYLSKLTT